MSEKRRRDIPYTVNYSVDEDGQVMNKRTGRILKPRIDRCGYAQVALHENGKRYDQMVHRLVADAFLEQPNEKSWQVNHKNGNKQDNRLRNLEYVTPSYNMKHAYKNGLNHWKGYNESPVRIVETGEIFKSQAECARAIGGSQPNINACLQARRHTHMGYHYEYVN